MDELSIARESLAEAVRWADVVYLSGGHVPTENEFITKCDLKGALKEFDGIFMALSAGSVNSADEAYLIPELPGESVREDFVRFKKGLGLTRIQMIPHYQYYSEGVMLDGKRLVDDIIARDSIGRSFYLLPDGSYFIIRNGVTELFGEALIMQDGKVRRVPQGVIHSENIFFEKNTPAERGYIDNLAQSFMQDNYDAVFSFNESYAGTHFYHISEFLLRNGFIPVNIDSFDFFNRNFSERLVVEDEKQAYLDQLSQEVVFAEIERDGEYVRTVHIDTPDGIQAEKVTIRAIDIGKKEFIFTMVNTTDVLDHDWMTDIYSRSGFLAKAHSIIRYSNEELSLVYTNVQGFKAMNDLLGTFSGDMAIFQQRDVIRQIMKPLIMARLEADHYVFVTRRENITEQSLNELCRQIYKEDYIEYPFQIRCGILHIRDNVNIRLSAAIDRAKLAENLIPNNRDRYYAVYDEKMREEYLEQRVLVSELDQALETGEFVTYYQPVVDIKSREIVSAEALVRWNHHELGMLSPARFVPAFEQRGVITKIDYLMVNNVLLFNSRRQKSGKKYVPCAVNISRVDFYDSRFIESIMNSLKGSDNVQKMLKLEVTESAYEEIESNARDFLTEVKRLGMSVLLDDFGSGMSSMSTLESYEFDVVKLDMGFVRKIGKSRKAEAIIKSIIELSHAVGAKVVAEGVEEENQLSFLDEAGCDMIQGYYFYRPMPEAEFVKLLDKE